jgi:probable phosphoglycerate mutase
MPRLALIRHAPTDWSAAGRLQGRNEQPLSAAGRAAALRWHLPPPVDAFPRVASPLLRCRETAQLLQPPRPFAVEPRLIEMDFGAWEGRTLAEIHAAEPDAAAREALGLDFRAPGGESPREVQARLIPWLASLPTDTLAVTHKGVIRALYALATGWPMLGNMPDRLRLDALQLFAVDADGAIAIDTLNLPLAARAAAGAAP